MLTKTCPECGNQFGPGKGVNNFKTAKYCSNDCYQASKKFSPSKADKFFWPKVAVRGNDDCWLYGRTDVAGYGRFLKTGPYVYAHRVAWLLTRGDIPEGMEVAHTCDVRACCNPAHLFLATHQENMNDCKAKGRNTRGEGNKHALLTEAEAIEIIRDYKQTAVNRSNIKELAKRYPHVTPQAIVAAAKGRSWKHLHGKQCGDVEKP